jgi:hypothetical protein
MEMASTKPTELPSATVTKDGTIAVAHSSLTKLWLASEDIFGYTKEKVEIVYSKSKTINPPT